MEQFGSSKMKKIARSRKRAAEQTVGEAASIKEHIQWVRDSAMGKEDVAPDESSYLPTINPEATSLENIYDIDQIIPSEFNGLLSDQSKEFKVYCLSESGSEGLSKFIKGIIDESPKLKRLKWIRLLFWYYLHSFHSRMSFLKTWTKAENDNLIGNIPEQLIAYFKSNFLLHGAYSRSMKIKCLSHLVILSLFINDFNLHYVELTLELKMKLPVMKALLKQLGCTFDNSRQRLKSKKSTNSPEEKGINERNEVARLEMPSNIKLSKLI
ncbi:hypothetical protein RF11_14366 [Thelohanellus kitauei]|uniref:DNA-directed RNA polymerase I subunit RPA49 n=1 Tax=Thelohanellus kitauei TaxID=669202 RepID=A0A0C2J814_THEKT|nr:hypothetical protein RF11_14366 [Thelohanellus kitauei]